MNTQELLKIILNELKMKIDFYIDVPSQENIIELLATMEAIRPKLLEELK